MADQPEVSVLIPTRDRCEWLARTVHGALGQAGVDHEVVVVDDGSRDGTSDVLRDIGDPRLRIVQHERSKGVAAARNRGLAEARGAWVAFLDDDDLWSPEKLSRQLRAGSATGADWVYGSAVRLTRGAEVINVNPAPVAEGIERRLLAGNVIPAGSSNVMARAEAVRRAGAFDERLSQLADWDLWLRLAAHGSAASIPDVLVGYVMHDRNMVLGSSAGVQAEFSYLAAKHGARGLDRAVDGADFARFLAGGHRRAGKRRAAFRVYLHSGLAHRNPGNVVRAAGVLMGERAMTRVRGPLERPAEQPPWLERYR